MASRRTWTTEGPGFEGASDSIIEGHRPNPALDPGRRSGVWLVLLGFILLAGGLGFGAWWFRSELADAFTTDETEGETGASETEEPPSEDEQGATESGEPNDATPPDLPAGPSKPSPWGG